jgi:hypothetical protein
VNFISDFVHAKWRPERQMFSGKEWEESRLGHKCVNKIEFIILGEVFTLLFPGSMVIREKLPAATADS